MQGKSGAPFLSKMSYTPREIEIVRKTLEPKQRWNANYRVMQGDRVAFSQQWLSANPFVSHRVRGTAKDVVSVMPGVELVEVLWDGAAASQYIDIRYPEAAASTASRPV
jgi:hypothetical protein